jgi:hypothetical protein
MVSVSFLKLNSRHASTCLKIIQRERYPKVVLASDNQAVYREEVRGQARALLTMRSGHLLHASVVSREGTNESEGRLLTQLFRSKLVSRFLRVRGKNYVVSRYFERCVCLGDNGSSEKV